MSLLDVLHNALGGGEIKRKPQTRATAKTTPAQRMGAYEDGSGVGGLQQRRPQGIPIQSQGLPNIGNTAGMGLRQSIQGGGYNPGAVALQYGEFPQVGASRIQPAMEPRWQNTDGRLRDMVNPQVEDNGFYYY